MNFYFHTEFLEGTQKSFFGGRSKPTIELISLAIINEHGHEFYAICKEFNLKEAWNRKTKLLAQDFYPFRNDVLKPIFYDLATRLEPSIGIKHGFSNYSEFCALEISNSRSAFKKLLDHYGYTRAELASMAEQFVNNSPDNKDWNKFIGYYSEKTWVSFLSLFGNTENRPQTIPSYQTDLRTVFEELKYSDDKYSVRAEMFFDFYRKNGEMFPTELMPCSALAQAKFNFRYHRYLMEFKRYRLEQQNIKPEPKPLEQDHVPIRNGDVRLVHLHMRMRFSFIKHIPVESDGESDSVTDYREGFVMTPVSTLPIVHEGQPSKLIYRSQALGSI